MATGIGNHGDQNLLVCVCSQDVGIGSGTPVSSLKKRKRLLLLVVLHQFISKDQALVQLLLLYHYLLHLARHPWIHHHLICVRHLHHTLPAQQISFTGFKQSHIPRVPSVSITIKLWNQHRHFLILLQLWIAIFGYAVRTFIRFCLLIHYRHHHHHHCRNCTITVFLNFVTFV